VNNLALPRLIFWIVTATSVPLALLIGTWVGEGRLRELTVIIGVPIIGILVLGVSQWLWPFAVGCIFLQGTLPILPAAFKPLELIFILLLARFIVEDIVFKRRSIYLGPRPDCYFILGLFAVVLIHGVQDRFGMRVLGSDIWGGRGYFILLLGFTIYFVLQSTRLDLRLFRHLPAIAVAFGAIEFSSHALTFAVPELVVPISGIYSGVASTFDGAFGRRPGFAGNFGYLLLFWSLADCRFQDFLQKGRFFKAAVFMLGLLLCLVSGYRSAILIAAIIVALAALRDLGSASVFMLLPIALLISSVLAMHLVGVQLPALVQRGLTMIPGVQWDSAAVEDARGSIEFRDGVKEVWLRQYFPQRPLVGRGFGLNSDDMMATMPYTSDEIGGYSSTLLSLSKYSRDEAFVVGGHLHHGFYSTIDRFGLLGAFCFVCWTIVALRRMWGELVSSRTRAMNPALQWLGLYIITFTVAFPLGALKIETFLPAHLFLCGLFAALFLETYGKTATGHLAGNASKPLP
jgi:hypothetical protein